MANDPKEMSRIHLQEAMRFFDNLFKVDPDLAECVQLMEVEEVRSFSALHEDPISDDQIELHIYACLVLAHKLHHAEPLEQVIKQTNMWIADVVQEPLEYVRRNQIRKKIIIVRNSYERMAESSHFRDSVATDAVNQALRDFYDRAKQEYIMYERNGSLHHLNGAIEWGTKIIDIPETYPGRAFFYYDLGYWLGKRYDRTWSMDDLNEAVKYAGLAVEFGGHDSEHQLQFHSSLGVRLRNRFMQTGVSQDIDKAIQSFDLALAIIPPSHPHKLILMNSLGRSLGDRFLRTGLAVDLSRAVALADDVVQLAPRDHPERPMFLHNLAEWLSRRFQQKGSVEDLNRAISASDLAYKLTVEGYHGRGTILTGLATFLGQRFHQIGLSADLERALRVGKAAIRALPRGHIDRAIAQDNLGTLLYMRYLKSENRVDKSILGDLELAISVTQNAVDNMPAAKPSLPITLGNLGNYYGSRFLAMKSISDLDQAIQLTSRALGLTPQSRPERAIILGRLATWLCVRAQNSGNILGSDRKDLEEGVRLVDLALGIMHKEHPDRIRLFSVRVDLLQAMYECTESPEVEAGLLKSLVSGWECRNAPASVRIHHGQRAAALFAIRGKWSDSSLILRQAIDLLPNVSPRSLRHKDKQGFLSEFYGLSHCATEAALNAGEEAIEALKLLESGRYITSSLLMDMRQVFDGLRERNAKLADEFEALRDRLDTPDSSFDASHPAAYGVDSSWELQGKQRLDDEQKFNNLLKSIRDQPGFEGFLLPPTSFEILEAPGPDTIIIINPGYVRCDAFILRQASITVLKLPVTRKDINDQARKTHVANSHEVATHLEWLWDNICGPILDFLGFKDVVAEETWPRIWWIPAGLVSQFPLHAAGYHTQGHGGNVLDRAMSSYSPSIRQMIHGRRNRARCRADSGLNQALLVAMRNTPGLPPGSDLPFVEDEVQMLKTLCPYLKLQPIMPKPLKKDVVQSLKACQIFHFAGHGRSNTRASAQSCMLLEDWQNNPLTVDSLRELKLYMNPPFLAYMSACSTGANRRYLLQDEGESLINGMQLAGFQHVIGTLWQVSDAHCVDIAKMVYETIVSDGMTDWAVCKGLHAAVRALRDEEIQEVTDGRDVKKFSVSGAQRRTFRNMYWVPYVHFGI